MLIATHVAQDPDATASVGVLILVGEVILFTSAVALGKFRAAAV